MSNLTELDKEYLNVSLEFRETFFKATEAAKLRLKSFFALATKNNKDYREALRDGLNNKVETKVDNQTLLTEFNNKTFVYSDLSKVDIFVPSILKDNATMLQLAKYLTDATDLCRGIMAHSGEECLSVINAYIGRPEQLAAVVAGSTPAESAVTTMMQHLTKLQVDFAKIANTGGTRSERQFGKAYRNFGEYQETSKVIQTTLIPNYQAIRGSIPVFLDLVERVNKRGDDLLHLINTKPDQYVVGNLAAQRLTDLMLTFAKEVDTVASVINLCEVYFKAFADTNVKLKKVVITN